jgi:hypothetical protein
MEKKQELSFGLLEILGVLPGEIMATFASPIPAKMSQVFAELIQSHLTQ